MPEYIGKDLILNELLATGGMGEVYRATQIGLGGFEKTVAVKRILPAYSRQATFTEMFLRETNISAKLQHPNIVQVFRNGKEGDHLYLVMEFVNGRTSDALIDKVHALRRFIPIGICAYIFAEASRALDHAHNYLDDSVGTTVPIVHRDITPSNIMLSFIGEVKIVDFGIAKAANHDKLTQTGEIKGKAAYLAPELIDGKEADARSDLFSLGIAFYEMLTGKNPFDGESTYHTIRLITDCNVLPPSSLRRELDPELDRIVLKLLKKEPRQRYASASAFHQDITAFLGKHFAGMNANELAGYLRELFREEIEADLQKRHQEKSGSARAAVKDRDEQPGSITSQTDLVGTVSRRPLAAWQIAVLVLLVVVNGMLFYRLLQLKKSVPEESVPSPDQIAALNQVFVPKLTDRARDGGVRGGVVPKIRAAISPGSLPNLAAWFKADSLRLKTGALIENWPDSSGHDLTANQSDKDRRPVFLEKAINDMPAVSFDGVGRFFEADHLAEILRGVDSAAFFIVMRAHDTRVQFMFALQNKAGLVSGPDSGQDVMRSGFGPGATTLRLRLQKDMHEVACGQPTQFGIIEDIIEPLRAGIFLNGHQQYSKKLDELVSFGRGDEFSIGQEYDPEGPSDFLNGEIAELIVFHGVLTHEQRQGIEQYLSDKYKIPLNPGIL